MSNIDPVTVVQGQLEAYNRKDLAAFASFYSPNVEIRDLSATQPTVSGLEGLRRLYAKRFSECKDLHAEVGRRLVFGSFVIDEETVTGLPNYPQGLTIGVIYRVENGVISSVWFTR